MSRLTWQEIVGLLNLEPLPVEGGYFRSTWGSNHLVTRFSDGGGEQTVQAGSAIYYLITDEKWGFSALHTLSSAETYHFYLGDPVTLAIFQENSRVDLIQLGSNLLDGQVPQYTVPAGAIQGSRLMEGGEWALLGTTMAPAYREKDFSLVSRKSILKLFPEYHELINNLTREEDIITGDGS